MARPKSLEPLLTLRRERAREQEKQLGTLVKRTARDRTAAESAERTRRAGEERARRTAAAERVRLEKGGATARDLAQGEAFRAGARARADALRAREEGAREKLGESERAESAGRKALGEARAGVRALERHHERLRAREARARENAEEEAAIERYGASSWRRKG